MTGDKVRALYFPYANFNNLGSLKTATLLFDKVAIIDPMACFSGRAGTAEIGQESTQYVYAIRRLIDKGILELIDPAETTAKFGKDIMTGIIQDLHNDDFIELCKPFTGSSWRLSSGKIPTDTDKLLRDLFVNVPSLAPTSLYSEQAMMLREVRLKKAHTSLERLSHMMREFSYLEGRYSKEDALKIARERNYERYREVVLPFPVGESIMISHTLAVSANHDFIPFCDEQVHFQALKVRIQKLFKNEATRTILKEYGYLKDIKESILAHQIVSQKFPSLEKVPLEDVLKFREKKAHMLEDFRIEVRSLVAGTENSPWDEDLQKYASDIVDSKVNPALRKIEREVRRCKEGFWTEAAKAIAEASPLPIIGSLLTGVPPIIALALGGATSSFVLALRHRAKMRDVKRNGWAFLLGAQELMPKYPWS